MWWAYLIGTIETSGHHLIDDIHQVLCFAYHVINFHECGSLSDRRFLHGELECLHIRGYLVQVVEKVFFGIAGRDLVEWFTL